MSGDSSIPPGWYHMQGDPPGTHRWWDGLGWTAQARSLQPAAPPVTHAGPAVVAGVSESGTSAHEAAANSGTHSEWDKWDQIYAESQPSAPTPVPAPAEQMPDDSPPVGPDSDPLRWMLLPYRNYANFKDRSCRAEFWWFLLFIIVITFILWLLGAILSIVVVGEREEGTARSAFEAFLGVSPVLIFWAISVVPGVALHVRRLHDTNRSGWILIGPQLISMVAAILPFIFGTDALGLYILVLGLTAVYSTWVGIIVWFLPGGGWNKYGTKHLHPDRSHRRPEALGITR